MLRNLGWLALAFVACSGVEEGEASPYATVDGFCAEWAQAACNDTVVQRCSAADTDACTEAQQAFCESIVPDGRYAPSGAKDCVNAVEDAYDDAILDPAERAAVYRLGSPCDLVLSGDGGDGDACDETADCNTEQGLVCVKKADEAGGRCRVPVEAMGGHDCSGDDVVCVDGFYCDGSNCLANKMSGAACSETVPCAAEFNCERPDGSMPDPTVDDATCVAKAAVGSDCEKDADCLSDICAIASTAVTGVCSGMVVLSPTDPICENLR